MAFIFALLLAPASQGGLAQEGWQSGTSGAMRPGFDASTLPGNDDGSTEAVPIGFNIDFFGTTYRTLFVNNNGNVTFDFALGEYTPFDLTSTAQVIIAPFFADVDTGIGNVVTYGAGVSEGQPAFGVNWPGVGCFAQTTSVLNTFQVLLIDRSDVGAGDFDIEFNYNSIQWEAGQASGGDGSCLGGSAARAGYSNGSGQPGTFFELAGSAVNGAFLDSNQETGLIHRSLDSAVPGRYLFRVRGGIPQPTNTPTVISIATATPTNAESPTSEATATATSPPATDTPTATPLAPTATPLSPTATATRVSPTATRTPTGVLPTATRTATRQPTVTPSATRRATRTPTRFVPPTVVATSTLPPPQTPPATAIATLSALGAFATEQAVLARAEARASATAVAASATAQAAVARATGEAQATATSLARTATASAPIATPSPTRESSVLGASTPGGPSDDGEESNLDRTVFGVGAGEPETTAAVLGLDHVSKDPRVIGTNIILAIILLIVLLTSSTVFDETINEHRVELQGVAMRTMTPLSWLSEGLGRLWPGGLFAGSRLNLLFAPILLLGATAFVYSLNEPHLALDGKTALLFSSLLISIGVITYVAEGGEALMTQRRFGVESSVRLVPIAICLAGAFVLLSRLVSFDAPIMYGFIASATVLGVAGLERKEAVTAVLVPAIALLATCVGAWLVLAPLRDAAEHQTAWWAHVPSEGAAALFAGGIEGLLFVLLPLRFTDGEKIFRWYRWLWFPLFGISAFLFAWVILNPQAKAFDVLLEGRVVFIACLVCIYAAIAGLVWAYFAVRRRGESNLDVT